MEFGVGVVEVGREAEDLFAAGQAAEGSDDAGGFEGGMESGQVLAGVAEGEDAARVFERGVGVEHGVAFGLERGDEPGALAEEFPGNGVDADFFEQFESGAEAEQAGEVGRAGFVAPGVGLEDELLLGQEIGRAQVVPALDDGVEVFLGGAADDQEPGGTGAEEPLVGVGGEEIRIRGRGGKGAEGLDGVDGEEDVARPQFRAERFEFEPPPGDEVAGGERDEAGVFVHLAEDIARSDGSDVAHVEQADFDAALGERHPRVDVGRIIVVVNEDILLAAKAQAARDEAEREGGGADKGHLGRIGSDKTRGLLAGLGEPARRERGFLVGFAAGVVEGVHGGRDAPRQRADAGMGEKDFPARDRKFMVPQFLVRLDVLNRHGKSAAGSNPKAADGGSGKIASSREELRGYGIVLGLCRAAVVQIGSHLWRNMSFMMTRVFASCAAGLLLAASLPVLAAAQAPAGFTAIFNGTDLSGWYGLNMDPRKYWAMSDAERAQFREKSLADVRKHWTVQNGELVNDGHGDYLTTEKEYGDIELLIDYKTVAQADSGIYLRGNPQVQIWDYTKEGGKWNIGADKGSGGLWNNSPGRPGKDPLALADKPFGEWNAMRIIQIGARTTIYLNGKLVVDHANMENFWDRKRPLWAKGPLQLQTHGGEIRWRNVFAREIGAEEANRMLAARGAEGFKRVDNGRDFTGWAGPTDQYEIKDGAMVCKPGKGGTIYYNQELTDFVARMEFKLPLGGNNGLAIRYPGGGDTAYVGMCELQVLDNDAAKYKTLDPRQYHGSAYGMAAAERGFLRPTGEWNFQEVTVQGSTIKVELNGTVILDTDLSKVSEYMANTPHPGKTRASGYFGLAGHADPVAFRHLQIKSLR